MQRLFELLLVGLHLVQEGEVVGDAFQRPAQIAVFIQHADEMAGEYFFTLRNIYRVKLFIQYIIQRIDGRKRQLAFLLIGVALPVIRIIVPFITQVFFEAGFVVVIVVFFFFFTFLALKVFGVIKFFLFLLPVAIVFFRFKSRIFSDFLIHSFFKLQ